MNWKEGESNGASIDSYIIEMKVIDYEQQQQQINAIKLLSKRPEEAVDTTSLSVGQSCKLIGKDDLYWVYSVEESKVRLLNTQMNKKEYLIIDSSQVIPLSYSFTSSVIIVYIFHYRKLFQFHQMIYYLPIHFILFFLLLHQ